MYDQRMLDKLHPTGFDVLIVFCRSRLYRRYLLHLPNPEGVFCIPTELIVALNDVSIDGTAQSSYAHMQTIFTRVNGGRGAQLGGR